MSARNLDKHNRFRCITVGFRVSPEEHEHINVAVALSGLSKQEYCYRRCLGRDIVVQGNPKVYKALKDQLAAVLDELKRIEAGQSVDDELLENINLIKRCLDEYRDSNEYIITRRDPFQKEKEPCDRCRHLGYDYILKHRRK